MQKRSQEICLNDIINVEKVDIEYLYDLSIEDNHNYYLDVGFPILVHNSSKTVSLSQLAYIIARENKNKIISICSESMPHLKRGIMRDFFNFLTTYNLYNPKHHNKTDNIYKVGSSIIEFFSIEDAAKVHGASRDFLFVNEIQYIPYETFFQLVQRTNERIYADYNPVRSFWVDSEYLENELYKNDFTLIHSTIFDNPFISDAIKQDVLKRAQTDENYARVYLRGETGSVEGLIFPDFKIIDEIPKEFNLVGNGIDFGYNDPMVLIQVHRFENSILIDERYYETEKITADLIKFIKENNITGLNYADQSRTDSISEIQRSGIYCIGARKGPGSIKEGINIIKKFNIFVTKRSVNTIKELRSYSWLIDKSNKSRNKYLDTPQDFENHSLDACRYVAIERLNIPSQRKGLKVLKRA